MKSNRPQILLTNDDGIRSPGLWAAAAALSELGYVHVVAPREQATSVGRSIPITTDGRIELTTLTIKGQDWPVYAVGGTPAQAVLHALLEVLPDLKPDLVVSGINYGENVGTGVTISGTIGAALEGASHGIPSLAVSLQIKSDDFYTYHDLDFSTAAYFTGYFAGRMLGRVFPPDVDLLKVDVPDVATPQTPWKVVRQSRSRYYQSYVVRDGDWSTHGYVAGRPGVDLKEVEPGSDVYALFYEKVVAVTPLSLDLTSRVNMQELEDSLRKE